MRVCVCVCVTHSRVSKQCAKCRGIHRTPNECLELRYKHTSPSEDKDPPRVLFSISSTELFVIVAVQFESLRLISRSFCCCGRDKADRDPWVCARGGKGWYLRRMAPTCGCVNFSIAASCPSLSGPSLSLLSHVSTLWSYSVWDDLVRICIVDWLCLLWISRSDRIGWECTLKHNDEHQ